jgi:excisionase family DNA binding protein
MSEENDNFDPLISLEDVARILGVCVRSVRRMADRGELPRPVKVGRAVRLFKSEVMAYLKRLREQRAV